MILECIDGEFSVCQTEDLSAVKLDAQYLFIGKTDEELSVVCRKGDVPKNCIRCEDGWRGFRVSGELDFSLVGILSKISAVLAENNISIFAVSTYNTDYVFVKSADFENALGALAENGYDIKTTH